MQRRGGIIHPNANNFSRSRSFRKLMLEAGFLLKFVDVNAFPLLLNRHMAETKIFMYVSGFH